MQLWKIVVFFKITHGIGPICKNMIGVLPASNVPLHRIWSIHRHAKVVPLLAAAIRVNTWPTLTRGKAVTIHPHFLGDGLTVYIGHVANSDASGMIMN